jgi:hypothetical protein
MERAQRWIHRLISSGMAPPNTVIGCTEDEIDLMEEHLNVQLPQGYRDFLRVAGKCAGAFETNSEWLFPEVLELTTEGRRFVARMEGGRLQLPEKAVVCARGSFEYITFFIADGTSDDPPIFIYVEEQGHFTKPGVSFWEMQETELEQKIEFRSRSPNSDFWRQADERAIERSRLLQQK